jgi:hypothetical protein
MQRQPKSCICVSGRTSFTQHHPFVAGRKEGNDERLILPIQTNGMKASSRFGRIASVFLFVFLFSKSSPLHAQSTLKLWYDKPASQWVEACLWAMAASAGWSLAAWRKN